MAKIVEVSSRKFVEDFSAIQELTKAGSSIRVVEGELSWLFRLDTRQSGFLGATSGTLVFQGPPEELFSTGENWMAEM